MRYWWSEGSNRFDIDSSSLDPTFYGSPTSKLTYDGVTRNFVEFFMPVRNETEMFFKCFVGGGWLGGLDDEDYFAGQVKFSDTYSKVDGEGWSMPPWMSVRTSRLAIAATSWSAPLSASTTGRNR